MSGEIIHAEELEKIKWLATCLAKWDKRIGEIGAIPDAEEGETKVNLICQFNPEPLNDSAGFFWIANLLTRMEFEGLKMETPFDLGFTIGREVFLPNGKIFRNSGDHIVLWRKHGE